MEKDWVKVQSYSDAIKSEMDKQMLEENGIPAVVLNKKDSSFMFGKIELYVNEKDEEQAINLLGGTAGEEAQS